MQECIPAADNTEAEVEAKELTRMINRFLSTCSREQRDVFVRRYWFFDSVAEIAAAFGISESKVKTMLFRMRKQLKTELEKGGYAI